jgi:hypothetical protein
VLFYGWLGANSLAIGKVLYELGQVVASGEGITWWIFKLLS